MTPIDTPTDLKVRQIMWSAAVYAAENLHLTRKFKIDHLWDGQLVLLATPNGMNIGKVHITVTEEGTLRHEKCYLNDQLIYEQTHDSEINIWESSPELVSYLPKQVGIFVENSLG
jgi:hypothetical protein